MGKLTAGTLHTILNTLALCMEPLDVAAPVHHKGVHITLEGKAVTFSTVKAGQTTVVRIFVDADAGSGHFMLGETDILELSRVLPHFGSIPVTLTKDIQPLTHTPCICFAISDQYQGYLAYYRADGFSKRSLAKRGRAATTEEIADLTRVLRPLSVSTVGVRVQLDNRGKESVVTILQPLPGVVSVKTHLY